MPVGIANSTSWNTYTVTQYSESSWESIADTAFTVPSNTQRVLMLLGAYGLPTDLRSPDSPAAYLAKWQGYEMIKHQEADVDQDGSPNATIYSMPISIAIGAGTIRAHYFGAKVSGAGMFLALVGMNQASGEGGHIATSFASESASATSAQATHNPAGTPRTMFSVLALKGSQAVTVTGGDVIYNQLSNDSGVRTVCVMTSGVSTLTVNYSWSSATMYGLASIVFNSTIGGSQFAIFG